MDYSRPLEVAIQAAKAAGEILRAEFRREGGPRGSPGKALVDVEAERAIRDKIQAAFPKWGYYGEETGEQAPARGEPHIWMVDPNDGTAAFQKGRRGSAISIGVLRDSEPVLGVVFAFAAPDDNGDLFTTAEGCGPLRRNGKPVERAPWPRQLGRYDIVLGAPGADRKATANAMAVAPARFRALPSVAYRLALAAAGDGACAVSLHSPGGWDYAGAHALLRATGGELFNERGEPVTYGKNGASSTKFCFGGSRDVAVELARRDWKRVLDGPVDPPGDYPLVYLEAGRSIADAALLSRAQGCLLGQVAGDALGSAVEFQPAAEIAKRFPGGLREMCDGGHWETLAGQPTDDSELALVLARSIIQAGKYDPEAAARAYAYWYRSHPYDCGAATGQALCAITPKEIREGAAALMARKAADQTTQANGSLMRISPLGIWGYAQTAEKLASQAQADASLTHPHAVCKDAAAVYAVAVARAVATGGSAREIYDYALNWVKTRTWQAKLREAVANAATAPPADYARSQGWVLTALQNAFYQLLHVASVEEGIVQTVMAGGDTDTNAAIAGALLGAVHGREGVPWQWRQMVLTCRPVEHLSGVRKPRPRAFWPVDALEVAERLLIAGKS